MAALRPTDASTDRGRAKASGGVKLIRLDGPKRFTGQCKVALVLALVMNSPILNVRISASLSAAKRQR